MAQRREYPLGHVGGGGLGEGDAEIFSGGTPSSNSRITRCTSTNVLPEPALAETNAEAAGSDARACVARTVSGMGRGAFTIPPIPIRRPPTIP